MKMLRLKLLATLMILCVTISSCATSKPDIYIKGVDYDDAVKNNEPSDKTSYMWITYKAAKKRLHWLNRNGK